MLEIKRISAYKCDYFPAIQMLSRPVPYTFDTFTINTKIPIIR